MKILITGAHFTPALATIEEFGKYPDIKIVYVGRDATQEGDSTPSIDSKILPSLGIKFIPITTGRLQMAFTPYTLFSLLRIPVGFIQALIIVLSEKPDVILSFGGYVAVPIIIVGWLFSIPIIVHEQTLVLGLANRISVPFADKIALSFERFDLNSEKTILTGNPIRKNILDMVTKGVQKRLPTILITGGNQGSHVINLAVEGCLDKLTKMAKVIHISGDNKFKDFERLEKFQNNAYVVKKWIDKEFGNILSKTDLVVSRAGVNTLTELAYLGIPALVIPIPYLYKDEQNKNARYFQKLGLVKILPQNKLSGKTLIDYIRASLRDLNHLKTQAKKARKIVILDAAKRLALETILLAQR